MFNPNRRRFLKLALMACVALGIVPKVAAKRYFTKATHEELIGMRWASKHEYEIVRECVSGDVWEGQTIMNYWRNKFWVRTIEKPDEEFLICLNRLKQGSGYFDLGQWRGQKFYKV